jgi:hypothetical protein
MIFSTWLKPILKWGKNPNPESEISALTLGRNPSLEESVLETDSDINMSDTDLNISPRNLLDEAYTKLDGANGDLSSKIYEFMQEFVFNASNLEKRGIRDVVNYLDTLARVGTDEKAREAAETAKTVCSHLDDYLGRQGTGENLSNPQGFKNYLFGKKGVLTQKRLKDMKKATKFIKENKNILQEKSNYKVAVGKDSLNTLNVSYTVDAHGRSLVNVNHNNSLGMASNYGRLYWGSLDQMFDSSVEGNVNTKMAITKYVKKSIKDSHDKGKVDLIGGLDWKNKKIEHYAKYLN